MSAPGGDYSFSHTSPEWEPLPALLASFSVPPDTFARLITVLLWPLQEALPPLSLGLERTCFFLLIFLFKQMNNILALKVQERWGQQLSQVGNEGVAGLPLGLQDALCFR